MSVTVKYIAKKEFKYGDKKIQPGEEFVPAGGMWDHIITDPDNRFVRLERVRGKGGSATTCESCGRTFKSERGLQTHLRYCEG